MSLSMILIHRIKLSPIEYNFEITVSVGSCLESGCSRLVLSLEFFLASVGFVTHYNLENKEFKELCNCNIQILLYSSIFLVF